MKEWGAIKRIALLMVVAALGFAMVACQGAVGPTGEEGGQGDQGDQGETGDPGESGGVAPALTADGVRAHSRYTLEVRDEAYISRQVNRWFSDPDATAETAALRFSVTSSNEEVATAELVQEQAAEEGETSTHLHLTAVARGRADVTVTATDPDDLSASVVLTLSVVEAATGPTIVGTIDGITVGAGETTSVNAGDSVDGTDLTYSAQSSDTDVATVAVEGSVVTVTGVADGTATITVTVTDANGKSVELSFEVTVGDGDQEEITGASSDCDTLDVGDTCKVMAPDGTTVRSGNQNLLTVTKKDGYWEVLAIAKGDATVEVRNSDTNALVDTFKIHINNRAPKRKGDNPGLQQLAMASTAAATLETPDYPDDGADPLFDDDDGDPVFVNSAKEPLYKIVVSKAANAPALNLNDYFTDPDGDDIRFTAKSSHPDRAIVVGYNEIADGTTEVLIDVLHNTGDVVTFTFSATDDDDTRARSADDNSLLLSVELRPVLSWRYDVGQFDAPQNFNFHNPRNVDYRRNDPDNHNDPDPPNRRGWHQLVFTGDENAEAGFKFAQDMAGVDGANHNKICGVGLATPVPADRLEEGTAEMSCYVVTSSDPEIVKIGPAGKAGTPGIGLLQEDGTGTDPGTHTINVQVLKPGNATITVTYKAWGTAADGTPLTENSKDLSVIVNEVDEP
ncbi:MAG: hypothetical protein OXP28_17850 [Gammaproteobacteria bacterium]|nr:hypothetical protein [Gammaproteobacteria bacterium]